MATNYNITWKNLTTGETFTELIEEGLREEVKHWAKQMDLGEKIATRKADDWDESGGTTYHYYHNGRVKVTTRYNQYTTRQRMGNSPMPEFLSKKKKK
jgi:hypothetical protein